MTGAAASPFSRRTAILLVVAGACAFLALLWLIGSNLAQGERNNGGAHAAGKGLTGYAALAEYLGRRGYGADLISARARLSEPGLLVLTPPLQTDLRLLDHVVAVRRHIGPTMVIMPKWIAMPQFDRKPGEPEGWVRLIGTEAPEWPGFHDEITLDLAAAKGGARPGTWVGRGMTGTLPRADAVMTGEGDGLVPLVADAANGRMLAAYVADGGDYPGLRALALKAEPRSDPAGSVRLYPLIFVFEPDLLNNLGLARLDNARLAERLVRAATSGGAPRVTFDLTFNGLAQADNLLTLAFTPPFLAATLCLMLAALVIGWRAFNRFGPPLAATGPEIAFGKRALVENAAGLIQRARRLHLVGPPFADAMRTRLARALALPQRLDPAETDAAIDRALAARAPQSPAFSAAAAAMRDARRPAQLLRAAQTLHSLERILTK